MNAEGMSSLLFVVPLLVGNVIKSALLKRHKEFAAFVVFLTLEACTSLT